MKKAIASLENELKSVEERATRCEGENMDYEAANERLKDEKMGIKTRLHTSMEELANTKERASSLDKDLSDFKHANSQLGSDLVVAKEAGKRALEELRAMRVNHEPIVSDLKKAKSQLQDELEEGSTSFTNSWKAFESEIRELFSRISTLQAEPGDHKERERESKTSSRKSRVARWPEHHLNAKGTA
jgi:chromosome segregation ATPase